MTIKDLKEQLEAGLEIVCEDGGHKLKKDLTIGDLAKFKAAVSAVNDILVVAQTCAFADEIGIPEIKDHIEQPNKNGFDVQYFNENTKVLAELKATIPCGKDGKYGANQKQSIAKDLKNLSGESEKGKKLGIDLTDGKTDKYMVLIGLDSQKKALGSKMPKTKMSVLEYANANNITVITVDDNVKIFDYDMYGWKDTD